MNTTSLTSTNTQGLTKEPFTRKQISELRAKTYVFKDTQMWHNYSYKEDVNGNMISETTVYKVSGTQDFVEATYNFDKNEMRYYYIYYGDTPAKYVLAGHVGREGLPCRYYILNNHELLSGGVLASSIVTAVNGGFMEAREKQDELNNQ